MFMAPLLLWSMVLLNGIINRHYHVDGKGLIISHAHPIPYGNQDHAHTEEELIFWDLISNPQFQTSNPIIQIPENLEVQFPDDKGIYRVIFLDISSFGPESLRGPPNIS